MSVRVPVSSIYWLLVVIVAQTILLLRCESQHHRTDIARYIPAAACADPK